MKYYRRGKFQPKQLVTLRAEMFALIGCEFDLTYAGTGHHDEPYPGQTRWLIDQKHDPELKPEQRGRWIPEEDIEWTD